MNLRFWGGWFLALAGIGILLTMGCEKGALGVKPALVTGRIIDSEAPIPVPNATIRMVSKEKFGSGEVKQAQNFATAVTNADGRFVFENVVPDNVLFEYSAKDFIPAVYPSSESPAEGQTAMVDFVSIKSGSVLNVGDLKLTRKADSPLAAEISVKLDLRDKTSKEPIKDNREDNGAQILFDVYLNGQSELGISASALRDQGISIPSSRTLRVVVRNSSTGDMLYNAYTMDYNVSGDIVEIIELEPVTYNLYLRAVNVPDYIRGGVINIFAERPSKNGFPPKVLARQTIDNLGNLSGPNLPVLVEVPGLQEPVDVRIQIRGYKDEVLEVSAANLPAGTQGNYRIDIDFLHDNDLSDGGASLTAVREGRFAYLPDDPAQNFAGMFNNMLRRDVVLRVAGEDLVGGNLVQGIINLPSLALTYNPSAGPDYGQCVANGSSVDIEFRDVAIGYDLYYTVTVSNNASGSYNLSNGNAGIMINPPVSSPSGALAIGINAKRPTS